jgi:hypothetical protein
VYDDSAYRINNVTIVLGGKSVGPGDIIGRGGPKTMTLNISTPDFATILWTDLSNTQHSQNVKIDRSKVFEDPAGFDVVYFSIHEDGTVTAVYDKEEVHFLKP